MLSQQAAARAFIWIRPDGWQIRSPAQCLVRDGGRQPASPKPSVRGRRHRASARRSPRRRGSARAASLLDGIVARVTEPDEVDALAALLSLPDAFDELDSLGIAQLRRRTSYKWTAYPGGRAPGVRRRDGPSPRTGGDALRCRKPSPAGDCGYANDAHVADAFAAFADASMVAGVRPAPGDRGAGRDGRRRPGDRDPHRARGRRGAHPAGLRAVSGKPSSVSAGVPVDAPMRRTRLGGPGRLDTGRHRLGARRRRQGGRCCATRTIRPAASRPRRSCGRCADAAARTGAGIISDEVHAPLTLAGPHASPRCSLWASSAPLTVTSASKSWNVAGLKCALIIAGDAATATALTGLPVALRHPGHFGVLAASAAFSSAAGRRRLARARSTPTLRASTSGRAALLAVALPKIRVPRADSGYLLWLDCRELGPRWRSSPLRCSWTAGKVALSPGLEFGRRGCRLRPAERRHQRPAAAGSGPPNAHRRGQTLGPGSWLETLLLPAAAPSRGRRRAGRPPRRGRRCARRSGCTG